MEDKIRTKKREEEVLEIEKWSLKGSKKIMWDRIVELELIIVELKLRLEALE